MDGQSEWLLCTVIKIGYGLFSYALQPAKRTSASFMGAILEEYLVIKDNTKKKLSKKFNLTISVSVTRYSSRIAPINDALVRLAGCKAYENKP